MSVVPSDRQPSSRLTYLRQVTFGSAAILIATALSTNSVQAAEVHWQKDLRTAAREAAGEQKPMLVMFTAQWCVYCRKMLSQTFPNPAVAGQINQQFVPVLIDADQQQAVVQRLRIESMPTVLLVNPNGKVAKRLTGFQSANQLTAQLSRFGQPVPPSQPYAANRPTLRQAPSVMSPQQRYAPPRGGLQQPYGIPEQYATAPPNSMFGQRRLPPNSPPRGYDRSIVEFGYPRGPSATQPPTPMLRDSFVLRIIAH